MSEAGAAAVVFDMDGLLLDSEAVYRSASRRAAADLGYEFSDALYQRLIGRHHDDVEREILRSLGEDFPLDGFRERWHRHWDAIVEGEGIARKSGAEAVLEFLGRRRVPFAIATSTGRERALRSLAAAGLGEVFEILVCGDHVSRGKPAPDIYELAARRLGAAPARCIALEDSEPGVLAAAAAGMTTVMVPDLHAPSPAARAAAHHVLDALDEAIPLLAELLGAGARAAAPR